jgi:hypothetical protein
MMTSKSFAKFTLIRPNGFDPADHQWTSVTRTFKKA